MFENIIYCKTYNYLKQFLIQEHYGSLDKKSIETNLLVYKEDICENFLSNSSTYTIYTDIKKGFDTINHELLIFKLCKYGIKDKILDWFKSYLNNRKQYHSMLKFITVNQKKLMFCPVHPKEVILELYYI